MSKKLIKIISVNTYDDDHTIAIPQKEDISLKKQLDTCKNEMLLQVNKIYKVRDELTLLENSYKRSLNDLDSIFQKLINENESLKSKCAAQTSLALLRRPMDDTLSLDMHQMNEDQRVSENLFDVLRRIKIEKKLEIDDESEFIHRDENLGNDLIVANEVDVVSSEDIIDTINNRECIATSEHAEASSSNENEEQMDLKEDISSSDDDDEDDDDDDDDESIISIVKVNEDFERAEMAVYLKDNGTPAIKVINYNKKSTKKLQCPCCPMVCKNQYSIITHFRNVHLCKQLTDKIKYKCHICTATFHSMYQLPEHLKRHENDALKCEYCSCLFKQLNFLNRHKKTCCYS